MANDLLAILKALKEDAAGLRAAGILEVEVAGVRVSLAPSSPAYPEFDTSEGSTPAEDADPAHPLDDALTFHGGQVLPRARLKEEVGR